MLWPPCWTSHVTESPDMIETSLGENESLATVTVAGEAIAGAATARAAPAATAKGMVRLAKARWLRMGMLALLVRTRRDAGSSTHMGIARCRGRARSDIRPAACRVLEKH